MVKTEREANEGSSGKIEEKVEVGAKEAKGKNNYAVHGAPEPGNPSTSVEETVETILVFLHNLLSTLAVWLDEGATPKECIEALRPELAELAEKVAKAFKSVENAGYLAKSLGVRPDASKEEIQRVLEEAFLRIAEREGFLRIAERSVELSEDDDLFKLILASDQWTEYLKWKLGRLLRIAGIPAIGVTLAALANDPAWVRRSIEAIATVSARAALTLAEYARMLADNTDAEEAAWEARNLMDIIKYEVLERAKKRGWRLVEDLRKAAVIRNKSALKLVLDGVEIGQIVEEKIGRDPYADTKLTIELPGLRAELKLNKEELSKAVHEGSSKESWRIAEDLGYKAFKAAFSAQHSKNSKIVKRVLMLALALEKYLKAEFGKKAKEVVWMMWHKIDRLWEDGIDHETAYDLLRIDYPRILILGSYSRRRNCPSKIESLLNLIGNVAEEIRRELEMLTDNPFIDSYPYLPKELKMALTRTFLNYAPKLLRKMGWGLSEFDIGASEAKKLPGLKEYAEALEKIADLLKAAAREFVERARREERYSLVEINGKLYPAYEGPVELSARVEHVKRGEKTYAVIEAKYGDRTARVELDIEKYRRHALLANLAAIAMGDAHEFYKGRLSHHASSYFQAAERLLMWALFMPGEYKMTVRYVYAVEGERSIVGLPDIVIESHLGLAKIERESPIHRLVLRLARELAGGDLNKVENAEDYVLAASWLLASVILNTPDGGHEPSKGLAILAERLAEKGGVDKGRLRAVFDRLRPIFEELDKELGLIPRVDKVRLVGKLVDYGGMVEVDVAMMVEANIIKEVAIELDGMEIRMADVAEAAAKAFSEKGGWSDRTEDLESEDWWLYFGPVEEVPELKAVPAFKAIAALKADELRREELVEYGEPVIYKGGEAEVKITPVKAKRELMPITPENFEEIWKGFESGYYTRLQLDIYYDEYELLSKVKGRNAGRVAMKFVIHGVGAWRLEMVQLLAENLRELGLNVKPTSRNRLYLYRRHLEALVKKGVEAYAVRKAKGGEAMWPVEITYRGRTMALKMTIRYMERDEWLVEYKGHRSLYSRERVCLSKGNRTGRIEAIIYEEGAAEGKRVRLDLGLLAAIREGRADCDGCLEKWLAEVLNAVASKNPYFRRYLVDALDIESEDLGFKWSVVGERVKHLYVYLLRWRKTLVG